MFVIMFIFGVSTLHGVTVFAEDPTAAGRRLGPFQHLEGLLELEVLEVLYDSFAKVMPTLFPYRLFHDLGVYGSQYRVWLGLASVPQVGL